MALHPHIVTTISGIITETQPCSLCWEFCSDSLILEVFSNFSDSEIHPSARARLLLRPSEAELCAGPGPRGWAEMGFFWLPGCGPGSCSTALVQEPSTWSWGWIQSWEQPLLALGIWAGKEHGSIAPELQNSPSSLPAAALCCPQEFLGSFSSVLQSWVGFRVGKQWDFSWQRG